MIQKLVTVLERDAPATDLGWLVSPLDALIGIEVFFLSGCQVLGMAVGARDILTS